MNRLYSLWLVVALTLVGFSSGGCVMGYSVFPDSAWDAQPSRSVPEVLQFKMARAGKRGTQLSPENVARALSESRVFDAVRTVSEKPAEGLFVELRTKWVPPSAVAMTALYISYIFAFTLPSYSGSSGHVLDFYVYRDGEKVRSYQYRIYEETFVWLPALAVFWLNFFTPSEGDACRAVTWQFLVDGLEDGTFEPPGGWGHAPPARREPRLSIEGEAEARTGTSG